ncbi:hypothetical protein I4U23_027757 [Adineta vaga]|nr:hypothetical protein I4U23_027757 [Adineta vaga]
MTMNHLDIQVLPQRQSIATEHYSNASRNTSIALIDSYNPISPNNNTSTSSKTHCFTCLSSSIKRKILFFIFTMIIILIAVLVVCLTSPKAPSKFST